MARTLTTEEIARLNKQQQQKLATGQALVSTQIQQTGQVNSRVIALHVASDADVHFVLRQFVLKTLSKWHKNSKNCCSELWSVFINNSRFGKKQTSYCLNHLV